MCLFEVRYSKEPKSDTTEWMKKSIAGDSKTDVVLMNLEPFTDYAICVVAVKGVVRTFGFC